MRRIWLSLLAPMMLLSLVQSAGAESVTVQGNGDIDKMYVNNAQNAVTIKVYGLGAPCGGAQKINIRVQWGDTAAYQAEAGCYSAEWGGKELYYLPHRGDPESARKVDCSGFRLTYNSADGFYRAFVPRSCMPRADNRVKVSSSGNNYGSMTGGSAGPTRSLRRG